MTKRSFIGTISSLPSPMTAKVEVIKLVPHPKYKKVIKIHSSYLSHYTDQDMVVGNRVEIEESRPISKMKKWTIVKKFN